MIQLTMDQFSNFRVLPDRNEVELIWLDFNMQETITIYISNKILGQLIDQLASHNHA